MNEIDNIAKLIYPYTIEIMSLPLHVKDKVTDVYISVGSVPKVYVNDIEYKLNTNEVTNKKTMEDLIYTLCEYSVYKHIEEIKKGFICAKGKYRVGIAGTAVKKGTTIENIKDINSLTIRVARLIKDSAKELYENIPSFLDGVLIVGEPSCGKTTILKDLIVRLNNKRLVVLDERHELMVGSQNFSNTVLCAYPKKDGISHAIRNLGAQIIICDELEDSDIESVRSCASSGVSLIATVHGDMIKGKRPLIKELIETYAFKYIIQLEKRDMPCKIKKIWRASDLLENSRVNINNGRNNVYRNLQNFGS